jgi:hypothetical protein
MRGDVGARHRLGQIGGRNLEGRLGFSTQAIARRPLPYSEFGHEVFLVDASAAVRLGEMEIGLDAHNLLDAAWYDGEFVYASNFDRNAAPSLVPRRHVSVGPPRSVLASLTLYL